MVNHGSLFYSNLNPGYVDLSQLRHLHHLCHLRQLRHLLHLRSPPSPLRRCWHSRRVFFSEKMTPLDIFDMYFANSPGHGSLGGALRDF